MTDTPRTLTSNSLALGHALRCGIPALRVAAIQTIIAALKEHGFVIYRAAKPLGVSQRVLHRWVAETPALRKAVDTAKAST